MIKIQKKTYKKEERSNNGLRLDTMELKVMMLKQGISQLTLARKIGVNHCVFNKYLNGWINLPQKYHAPLQRALNYK